jgi:hypothetical protein
MLLKNSNDTPENQTRDPHAFSAVPYLTVPSNADGKKILR